MSRKGLYFGLLSVVIWGAGYAHLIPKASSGETLGLLGANSNSGIVAVPVAEPKNLTPAQAQQLLKRYCIRCHKTGKAKGQINLTQDRTRLKIQKNGRVWQKMVDQTKHQLMPPPDEKQPTAEQRQALAHYYLKILRDIDCANLKIAGKPTLRRLNKVEYQRTINDLMGLQLDASRGLPDDAKGYGFTNIGDVMFLSPLLLEKYLDATQKILDKTFANPQALHRLLWIRPSRRVRPDDAAAQILGRFISRAFRRPARKAEVKSRVKLFRRAYRKDKNFNDAIKISFKSVLLSPDFLFRIEHKDQRVKSTPSYRINDYQLATRLSYFLWSTMPDDQLIQLAQADQLHHPQVLQKQISRMLAHPKSRALSSQFAGQWLRFSEIKTVSKDFRRFPQYSRTRLSMYQESELFFDDLVKNNRSVLNLLDSDYAFLDQKLAELYAIPGIKGHHFRKVKLKNRQRGGVLGMASILALTSTPLRTSPVIRGKWVMEEILGTQIPPPPANAGSLPKDDQQTDNLSFRKRLEQHRDDPACASCHKLMDPIGFGLENYDGIGAWREKSLGQKLDTSGVLPSGQRFKGAIAFKDILKQKKKQFARQITKKLLIYAYGRPLEYYDQCHIQAGIKALEKNQYQIHSLIQSVIMSYPFQHRDQ